MRNSSMQSWQFPSHGPFVAVDCHNDAFPVTTAVINCSNPTEHSGKTRCTWQCEMMTNLPTENQQWTANCIHWDSHRFDTIAALQPLLQHVGHQLQSAVS